MVLPVFPIKIGQRRIALYHQHILRVLYCAAWVKLKLPVISVAVRTAGVDHDHFVMSAVVGGIGKNRHSIRRHLRYQTRLNPVDLVLVGNYFHVHPATTGCDQCISNFAMGETECLHQNLVLRRIDSVRDELSNIISWREGRLYRPGRGKCNGCRPARTAVVLAFVSRCGLESCGGCRKQNRQAACKTSGDGHAKNG